MTEGCDSPDEVGTPEGEPMVPLMGSEATLAGQQIKKAENMKTYKCPLCESSLSEDRYLKALGAWQEKVKVEREFKDKLSKVEKDRRVLLEQVKTTKIELSRERKRLAEDKNRYKSDVDKEYKKKSKELERSAVQKGKQIEKQRADTLAKQLDRRMEALTTANRKIKELKEQLKKGTTSQTEGLDFEKIVVKELKERFEPEDRIEPHGKKGDILQVVRYKKQELGKILYECKKTDKFSKGFIKQTKDAVRDRKATFGVLVTAAFKKDTEGFYVENDVIVVHPFGVCYIAQILRNNIIELALARNTKKEIDQKAKNLIDYISGEEFRNIANDTIYKTKSLAELLVKEYNQHMSHWKIRADNYGSINSNVRSLDNNTRAILRGEKPQKVQGERLLELPFLMVQNLKEAGNA